MSLILNIDTSAESASVALCDGTDLLTIQHNHDQKSQASWIHEAISQNLKKAGKEMHQLAAVGVVAGPGSYTGLRVGMATAKGLCYALQIPLLTVNTLHAMAFAAGRQPTDLLCPMMDAGRMEVYTALYDQSLIEIFAPAPLILNEQSFSDILEENSISFFGSGTPKFQTLQKNPKANIVNLSFDISDFSTLIYSKFLQSDFTSLAYAELFYLKAYKQHFI